MVTVAPHVPHDRVRCAYHRRSNKYAATRNVRCAAVNDRGARCKKTVRVSAQTPDEAVLCNLHRPARHCTARTLEGKHCKRKVLAQSDAPHDRVRCAIHRKERNFVPPPKVKCVATRAGGRRCRRWALKTLTDADRPLCSYHAGAGLGQPAPPHRRRCTARKPDGQRCKAWAMDDGFCNTHAGLTGFEEGNEAAWKEGVVNKDPGLMDRHAEKACQGMDVIAKLVIRGQGYVRKRGKWMREKPQGLRTKADFEKWLDELPEELWEEVERMEAGEES